MKRIVIIFICCMVLVGCQQSSKEQERTAVVSDYDLAKAAALVAAIDKPYFLLQQEDFASRESIAMYEEELVQLTSPVGTVPSLEILFDGAVLEDVQMDPVPLVNDLLYPSVFHNGVEVTDAKVTTYSWEDPASGLLNRTELEVTVRGVVEELDGWERQYYFKEYGGGFYFESFGGTINLSLPRDSFSPKE